MAERVFACARGGRPGRQHSQNGPDSSAAHEQMLEKNCTAAQEQEQEQEQSRI